MTDRTTNLGLPWLMPSQAQKAVTVNESLSRLDALVQMAVESRSVGVQPGSPADGEIWIAPAGKTGPEWGGYADWALAHYRDGAWEPIVPRAGWRAWVKDEGVFARYTGAAWTADHVAASLNGGPLAGLRNVVVNGGFAVAQRGAVVGAVNGGHGLDRWATFFNGSGATRTISRQTSPAGGIVASPWCGLFQQSVAGSGATYNQWTQQIENVRTLAGSPCTLSFKAQASGALTIGCAIRQHFGTGGSADVFTVLDSIALDTSLKTIVRRFDMPSVAGKTIGPGDLVQLQLHLPINATFELLLGDVQLEPGPVATPFERRPEGMEEALCRRFYEVLGEGAVGSWFSAADCQLGLRYTTPKRVTPTLSLLTTTPTVAEPGIANRTGSGSTLSLNAAGPRGATVNMNGFSGATAQNVALMIGDFIAASAEL